MFSFLLHPSAFILPKDQDGLGGDGEEEGGQKSTVVLVGEQVGSPFTTGANGWYGYIALLPVKYVVTFTP